MAAHSELAGGDREIELSSVLQSFADEDAVNAIIGALRVSCQDAVANEVCTEQFLRIFDKYQEQPHLLDPFLDGWLSQLLSLAMSAHTNSVLMHQSFKFVYIITKVRGFKVILRHLPHEVADLEPVLNLLIAQDRNDKSTWETRYVLLLWLSIVVMIPFHMTRLDGNTSSGLGGKKPVIERILDSTKLYLAVNDKPQDAAAYLLSRFVTRPDVKEGYLLPFISWATEEMLQYDGFVTSRVGELSTLACIFKHGKREDLLSHAGNVLQCLLKMDFKSCKNTSLRKLSIKLTQRIGMTFLKPRLAAWRYQRGSRSLEANLGSTMFNGSDNKAKNGEPDLIKDDEDFDVPEEVEDVLQELLNGLKDKETVIRWSAAKGIGRVTGRLPKCLADEVVISVLECFKTYETDCAWHGGCFSIAELGRRGLLLPDRLPEVVPVILQALLYDEQKGSYSVGDHIRDAACYVAWAFARAYEPQEMKPYVSQIASSLLITTVFDREVHCRRAASAAFQENVGRQGTFPHGIDILTVADYFTVGNRINAFLELSVSVCRFHEYVQPLIDHLVSVKIHHWDANIRELSSMALHKLAGKNVSCMLNIVLPKLITLTTGPHLNSRHGSILAVAEIIHGISYCDPAALLSSSEILESIRTIVPALNEKKLFRGLGGELMRVACCTLIKKAALCRLPFDGENIIETWQNLIDDCLRHNEPKVQSSAAGALPPFCQEYYTNTSANVQLDHRNRLVDRYLQELQTTSETSRIGFTMALGVLPAFMLVGKLNLVVPRLIQCAKIVEAEAGWAKCRKEAVNALSNICTTFGVAPDGSLDEDICLSHVNNIIQCFLEGLGDYTTDSCGDVGSHVRLAAMMGLENILTLISIHHSACITAEVSKSVMCNFAQQAVERIDNVRNVAGTIFYNFLHRIHFPHIPHYEELCIIFNPTECADVDWKRPSETFFRFAKMLALSEYTYHILLGFCTTAGGFTEHLVRYSMVALDQYFNSPNSKLRLEQNRICDTLLRIFEDNLFSVRLTMPLMKTIDQLFSSGNFDDILQDPASSFPLNLLDLVVKEILKCKDPSKIMVSVTVICELLQCPPNVCNKVLSRLSILLCHRYPVVRRDTASKMFTSFISYNNIVPEESFDDIVNILSETDWGMAIGEVRPIRDQLCGLLNIPPPKLVQN